VTGGTKLSSAVKLSGAVGDEEKDALVKQKTVVEYISSRGVKEKGRRRLVRLKRLGSEERECSKKKESNVGSTGGEGRTKPIPRENGRHSLKERGKKKARDFSRFAGTKGWHS